jgi:OOP family OmpA-OmpF porin
MKNPERNRFAEVAWTLGLLAWATSGSGLAAESDPARGWYGGGSVGASRASTNTGQITSSLLTAGFATGAVTSTDESGTAFKLFGGYRFNRHVALEGGYFDLGSFSFVATTTGPAGSLVGTSKPRGVNFDAVGTLPIAGNFSALGRIGALSVDPNDSYTGSGSVGIGFNPNSGGKSGLSYKFGVGFQYDFTKSLGLRGEVERYRVDDSFSSRHDVDVYSAGLVFKFH